MQKRRKKRRLIENGPVKPSKSKIIWTYFLIVLILICCYLGIYHTHHFQDTAVWIFMAGTFCLLILQTMWFAAKAKNWDNLRVFLMLLLIGCPILFSVYKLQGYYIQKQLSEHGIITGSRVIDTIRKRTKHGHSYYAKFEYKINDKVWFQKVANNDLKIEIGDSLKLRCSSEEPEIFEVLEVKKRMETR